MTKEHLDEGPLRVLLIEDSPDDHALIRGMLESDEENKYDLTWADRLAAGLRTLTAEEFQLVLLDLYLPETKGLRTLQKVFERTPNVAVVVLTNLNDEATGLEAVREGAQEYLVKKHFDAYSLRRAIRHAVERARIESELRESEKKQRELNLQYQMAIKELESFSYSVSHDLRAPLRAITGFSEILSTDFRQELSPQAAQYLDNIVRAGLQMGDLIDDLLAYSRLGQGALNYQQVDLSELFTKIGIGLASRIGSTKTELSIGKNLPVIYSSASLLQQIFANLINNAMTYVAPGITPKIAIACAKEPDSVVFTVADNGIGIPEDQFARIFNVFQRLHSQDHYAGTGIGLSIVQKAVQILQGEVSVESTLDKGSVFTVRLPNWGD